MLRNYQQAAHDAAINWIKKTTDPCCLELATGAGKSHIIAALANTIRAMSNKHILCIAPSALLVIQNREKMLATGNKASLFSASAGEKCLKHPIVFGTPVTVKNKIKRFGKEFACVIIDECHGMTPTIKSIIEQIRKQNPNLRVIGLSATPYRMNQGYIYALDEKGRTVDAVNPFFTAKVYTVQARYLIEQGYLTRPIVGGTNGEHYETLSLELNSRGQFESKDIDKAFHGHGRKTAAIIADVVSQAQGRSGVIIFAATVAHAHECMASLPPHLTGLITGDSNDRDYIVSQFKLRKIKYLVNVNVLTVGFDAPHVDLIAILRATESVGLLQQIIGRGLRIDDNKTDCLILDYAENIERHCPDGDLFAPIVKSRKKKQEEEFVSAQCELCGHDNEFSARPNPDGFRIDANGYFVDYNEQRIQTEHGYMPAHYGRRCKNLLLSGHNHVQCGQRWTLKICEQCEAENDIAARYCCECKAEIVDPNEKLSADFKALKRDPSSMQTDAICTWSVNSTISTKGNECLRVDFVTEYRRFSVWYVVGSKQHAEFSTIKTMPRTVTYRKDGDFYKVYAYNRDTDDEILRQRKEAIGQRIRPHDNVFSMAQAATS